MYQDNTQKKNLVVVQSGCYKIHHALCPHVTANLLPSPECNMSRNMQLLTLGVYKLFALPGFRPYYE